MRKTFLLFAVLSAPITGLHAQWTVKPGGWFMSHGFNVGRFPDRFSGVEGATRNELDKIDWGMYFIYGLIDGLSIGRTGCSTSAATRGISVRWPREEAQASSPSTRTRPLSVKRGIERLPKICRSSLWWLT